PFSAVGAIWLFYLLDYNVSIAAWVGIIALLGLDAETGAFMLLFLDLSYDEAKRRGELKNEHELNEAIVHGAVKRARPKMMTVAAAFMGLLPIMWSTSAGADVMKRIAAPMIGGLITSFILELTVYPAVYKLWKRHELNGPRGQGGTSLEPVAPNNETAAGSETDGAAPVLEHHPETAIPVSTDGGRALPPRGPEPCPAT
ncbi:MAG TPA: efflux RND transporter permease subunit, partial [Polyangiaceae bacterium]|nr:efflux RND transporter permease subunit [Polyangiaceae bacterium]